MSGGRRALGQAPALQLPPIDDKRGGGHLRGGHRLARSSPKDTHEEATGAHAVVREIHHATTDDPVADPVAHDPVHGHGRDPRKAGDEVPGIELPSVPVPREGREDHERSRRDATETVDERFVGPILQHLQLHPVQERRDLAQRHGQQEGVHLRGPAYHHDALRLRLQRPRQRVGRDERQRLPPSGHIHGEDGEIEDRFEGLPVHDRYARKEATQPLRGESQRPRPFGHDGVGSKPLILLGEIAGELRRAVEVREAVEVQVLVVDLDAVMKLLTHHHLQLLRERGDPGGIGVIRV